MAAAKSEKRPADDERLFKEGMEPLIEGAPNPPTIDCRNDIALGRDPVKGPAVRGRSTTTYPWTSYPAPPNPSLLQVCLQVCRPPDDGCVGSPGAGTLADFREAWRNHSLKTSRYKT